MAVTQEQVIIVGASARAAAQSALRAGLSPWCIDLFADRDLQAIAPVWRCPAKDYPQGILEKLAAAPPGPVLCTGAMENHPEVLRQIARQRRLLTPSPLAAANARRLEVWDELPSVAGVNRGEFHQQPVRQRGRWLLKPRRSAGGHGIRFWHEGDDLPVDCYLQRFVPGTPVGAVYVAQDENVRLLGVSRQLIGQATFGAAEFKYVGSVGPLPLEAKQERAFRHLGEALVQQCALQGVFGIDAIIDYEGAVCPLEINPRYPASTEVLELATGNLALSQKKCPPGPPVVGKAIVYARDAVTVPDLYRDFAAEQIADVPAAGELIAAGHPICTLLVGGADYGQCMLDLQLMADRLYTRLSDEQPPESTFASSAAGVTG